MRKLLLLLALCSGLSCSAQLLNRIHPFADIGINYNGALGGSLTVVYKPIPFIGMGLGIQDYQIYSSINPDFYAIPAAFIDVRAVLPRKKSRLFVFGDLGKAFKSVRNEGYSHEAEFNYTLLLNLGFGYAYTFSRYCGIYITAKGIQLNTSLREAQSRRVKDYTGVLSIGYTF